MAVYRTKGVLTGYIASENVSKAQAYLKEDAMVEYVAANTELTDALEWISWDLDSDGHHWTVTAVTSRVLDDDELKRLSEEVSGQNSDGLGESFEQQDFAWETNDDDECDGRDDCEGGCEGWGCSNENDGRMISFDWEKNDCSFERVK